MGRTSTLDTRPVSGRTRRKRGRHRHGSWYITVAVTTISIVVTDGCMASAVHGIRDILTIAGLIAASEGRPAPVEIRVAGSGKTVRDLSGLPISTDDELDRASAADAVIVPPVFFVDLDDWLRANRDVVELLADGSERVSASVCTGAFLLAEAGLLDGRVATTNPTSAPLLAARYPRVRVDARRRLADEGAVISAGSTTAFLDLALHLARRTFGHDIAVAAAKRLCIDVNRDDQTPYFPFESAKRHGDTQIASLQEWLEANYADRTSLERLASRAGMSERTLHRRFRDATGYSPRTYLQRVRVEAAKHMLETSRAGIAEITAAIGYEDARSFGRLFRKVAGLTPVEYRRRFGPFPEAAPPPG
jgi:transcriptional regulator GlxA family with amidase domain